MATRIHYFGDVAIATRYKATAEALLESLRRSQPIPSSLKRLFPDGTRIVVTRATPEIDTIDIWAEEGVSKEKWIWTLLYAPCPLPDPQDWGGWIEADKTTLVATNFLNRFSLLPWESELWAEFQGSATVSIATPYLTTVDLGWVCEGSSSVYFPEYGTWYESPTWRAIGFGYLGTNTAYSVTTGIPPYIPNVTYPITSDTYKVIRAGGGYPTYPDGYMLWAGGPPSVVTVGDPVSFAGYEERTDTYQEGYISWESDWNLGVWKIEWTIYNPSSVLDENNYILFYDHYVLQTSTASGAPLYDGPNNPVNHAYFDEQWSWYEGYEQFKTYCAGPSGSEGNMTTGYTLTGVQGAYGEQFIVKDPKSLGDSYINRDQINVVYETHMCGKYEGVAFDEVIATATFTGGAWSGDNAFPWMGRIYNKSALLEGEEGQERPSEHNLLIASWLIGPAAGGTPNITNAIPGCSGITETTYWAKHGTEINVRKEYSASHPGWHDVYTQDGRTWRAYGDLFAALKKVRG